LVEVVASYLLVVEGEVACLSWVAGVHDLLEVVAGDRMEVVHVGAVSIQEVVVGTACQVAEVEVHLVGLEASHNP